MSKVLVRLMGGPADGQEWVAPEFRQEWLIPGKVSRFALFNRETMTAETPALPVYAYTFNPRLGRWTFEAPEK